MCKEPSILRPIGSVIGLLRFGNSRNLILLVRAEPITYWDHSILVLESMEFKYTWLMYIMRLCPSLPRQAITISTPKINSIIAVYSTTYPYVFSS